MVRIKYVRGYPVYVYRGTNYSEKPNKTVVRKMMYDADNNRTLVYCKRPSILFECVCLLVMLFCVFVNVTDIHKRVVRVNYNSMATYYNGSLYINLMNDNDSFADVEYSLRRGGEIIARGTLSPGECLISIPIETIHDMYELHISYKTLLNEQTESYKINVLDRSVSK